jgi:hypothetical protein
MATKKAAKKAKAAKKQHTVITRPAPKWEKYDGMDLGIKQVVRILAENGVETCQSCAASGPFGKGSGKKDGDAHAYPEPTVDFHGSFAAGFHALEVALTHGLPVAEMRRVWSIQNGEPVGPLWAMTFDLSPKNLTGWLASDAKPYTKTHGKCWCGSMG